jgi:hypothetical protein
LHDAQAIVDGTLQDIIVTLSNKRRPPPPTCRSLAGGGVASTIFVRVIVGESGGSVGDASPVELDFEEAEVKMRCVSSRRGNVWS